MHSSVASWEYVADLASGAALPDGRGIDVVLVQEALPPPESVGWRLFPDVADATQWRTTAPVERTFTTAIVVFTPTVQIEAVPVVPLNDSTNAGGDYLASRVAHTSSSVPTAYRMTRTPRKPSAPRMR
jgi:hypothetical protein